MDPFPFSPQTGPEQITAPIVQNPQAAEPLAEARQQAEAGQRVTQPVGNSPVLGTEAEVQRLFGEAYKALQIKAWTDAKTGFLAVLAAQPGFYPAHLMLGHLALHEGAFQLGLESYQQALALAPWEVSLQIAIGQAHLKLGQAGPAAGAFSAYLQVHPEDTRLWLMLAQCYSEMQYYFQEALCLEKVLQQQPHEVLVLHKLAQAWFCMGQRDGVSRMYQCLLQLNPAGEAWFADLPAATRQSLNQMKRRLHFEYLMFLYGEPELQDQAFFDYLDALPPPTGEALPAPGPRRPGKLRLGYLSSELTDCSSMKVFLPILQHHSERVELFAYNDTPQVAWTLMTDVFKHYFAHWRDVATFDNAQLADLIRSDGIDVLIDMGGIINPDRHGVLARKPAPIQIGGPGFCFSSGHRAIEYCFSDARFCPPEVASRYSETVLPLTTVLHWQCEKPYPLSAPPCLKNGFLTLGSANTLTKMNLRVLALWSRILQALPDARLILKTPVFNDQLVQNYWRSMFGNFGIAPERLDLLGQDGSIHITTFYPQIDIALDPFPYQGGITTCEALWMGVPVVSLLHPQWRARAGAAHILAAIGLEDWLASDEEAYFARVLSWAADRDFLFQQRQSLRERLLHSPICDGLTGAREIEVACFRLAGIS